MNRCDGKTALITGAARGLGAEAAKELARAGARVLLTDILDDEGHATADALRATGAEAHYVHHDVTDEAAWKAAIAEAVSRFGGLDVLVNNAGLYLVKPVEEITMDDWHKLMSVNVDGVFLGCREALPALREGANKWTGGGSIINLSSVAGLVGSPGHVLYNASKGAVRLMTKGLAIELAGQPQKVRVNSIHPGVIETKMGDEVVQGFMQSGIATSDNEARALVGMAHPLGRMGSPLDVANAVCFLASDDSAFVTGAEIVVDGGMTAQ